MMGRFLGQFGLSLAVAPIMAADNFPVNSSQMLRLQMSKSLNEFVVKSVIDAGVDIHLMRNTGLAQSLL